MEKKASPTQVMVRSTISHETVVTACQNALRAEIGAGKPYNITTGAEKIPCSEGPLRDYLAGESAPNLKTFLSMADAFGEGFLNRMLAVAGFGNAQRLAPAPVNEFQLNCETSRLLSALGEALEDGRVDHQEKHTILRVLPHLRELITAYEASELMKQPGIGVAGILSTPLSKARVG